MHLHLGSLNLTELLFTPKHSAVNEADHGTGKMGSTDDESGADMTDYSDYESDYTDISTAGEEESEEERWLKEYKSPERRCRDIVLDTLKRGVMRWDEAHGDTCLPVVENYKKKALCDRVDQVGGQATALHAIARDYSSEYKNVPRDILIVVLKYLLEHRAKTPQPAHDQSILAVANAHQGREFLELLDETFPAHLPDLISVSNEKGENFLHHMLGNGTLRLRKYLISMLKKAPKRAIVAQDKKCGNTPLHYAMIYRQCRQRNPQYSQLIKIWALRADAEQDGDNSRRTGTLNRKNESPYMVYLRTKEEWLKSNKLGSKSMERQTGVPKVKGSNKYNGKCDADPKMVENGKHSLTIGAPAPTPTINNTKPLDTVIAREEKVPTANRGRPVVNEDGSTVENYASLDTNAENARRFLKLHYLRTRSDLEARKLLYGKVSSNINLYLDLSDQEGQGADQLLTLIERLSASSTFDNTLSYVSLPLVTHTVAQQANPKRYGANLGRARESLPKPPRGRQSLVPVFDKLHQLGVQKILRLQIEDREYPSHTDASIEIALTGRESLSSESPIGHHRHIDIETWDWRKLDICSDVICHAAPHAEKVHLYWSGNPAVIKGWGSQEGIPELWSANKNLKSIVIHADQGLESKDRTEMLIQRFKRQILKHTTKLEANIRPINVEVKWDSVVGGSVADSAARIESSSRPNAPQQHQWIEHLEGFRSALMNIHKVLGKRSIIEPRRIKVAIVDDGCSLGQLDWYNNTVKVRGAAYCSPCGDKNVPWYTSSGSHGTTMVNMVTRIAPWAEIYMMKIEGCESAGGRTIYPKSAARAIQGAINHGVDIISMSWTIKHTAENEKSPEMEALRSAIREAREKDILMFCSASDDITQSAASSLPYSEVPGYAFRIGAALSLGQRDAAVEDANAIDYYLPGNRVADAWNPRSDKQVQYHTGSSIATALAAGLAALIMYCGEIVRTEGEWRQATDPLLFETFAPKCAAMRLRCNMKMAFDNIHADGASDDKKYPPVWGTFGKATTGILGETNRSDDEKLVALRELVLSLTTNFRIPQSVKQEVAAQTRQ